MEFIGLLPTKWFTVTKNSRPNVMTVLQMEEWEKNNKPLVHYDKPIDPRVSSFIGLDLKGKLEFIQNYDVSEGNPYFYSGLFGPPKPKTYTYIDQLNENNDTKELYQKLLDAVYQEDNGKKKVVKPKKKTIPKTVKNAVWIKYIGKEIGTAKCLCFKKNDIFQLDFECGHIIAEANNGTIEVDNLKPICSMCNKSMATMNMEEFIKTYFP